MRAVRRRDTAAELTVRRLLHRMGYRFTVQGRGLPGRPDIVLSARRKTIEVRGCFWHRHPDPACRNAVLPATRAQWWAEKLNGNVARDERNLVALKCAGWDVLVLWECEIRRGGLEGRLTDFLGPPRFRQNRNKAAFRSLSPGAYSEP